MQIKIKAKDAQYRALRKTIEKVSKDIMDKATNCESGMILHFDYLITDLQIMRIVIVKLCDAGYKVKNLRGNSYLVEWGTDNMECVIASIGTDYELYPGMPYADIIRCAYDR